MLIMFIKAQKGVNFAFYFCCSPPYLHSDDIYFDNGAGTMVEIWQNLAVDSVQFGNAVFVNEC